MRRLTITAIASGMLVAVPAQAIEPADYQGVAAAPAHYKSAMEKRDLTGVEALFAPDGQIFESGGVEGNLDRKRGVKGSRVAVRVDLGGRRIIQKKTTDSTLGTRHADRNSTETQ